MQIMYINGLYIVEAFRCKSIAEMYLAGDSLTLEPWGKFVPAVQPLETIRDLMLAGF